MQALYLAHFDFVDHMDPEKPDCSLAKGDMRKAIEMADYVFYTSPRGKTLVLKDRYGDVEYTVKLNTRQLDILIQALDLYGRIGMGDYEECLSFVYDSFDSSTAPEPPGLAKAEEDAKLALREVLRLRSGLDHGGHPGIRSEQVGDRFKAAYDMQQILRNQVWNDRGGGEWSTWASVLLITGGSPVRVKPRVPGSDEDWLPT